LKRGETFPLLMGETRRGEAKIHKGESGGASPLQRKVLERRSLSYKSIPLPLAKGKGIKGIGLIR